MISTATSQQTHPPRPRVSGPRHGPRQGAELPPAELQIIEGRRHRARLHLFTYLVGNALLWTLWGAISISANDWYWWPVVPFAGWTLVLALHLWHVYRA